MPTSTVPAYWTWNVSPTLGSQFAGAGDEADAADVADAGDASGAADAARTGELAAAGLCAVKPEVGPGGLETGDTDGRADPHAATRAATEISR